MTTGTHPGGQMTIRLRTDVFNRFADLYGWKSHGDVARAISVSRPQVRRIREREQSPSVAFISGFLHAVPEAGFDQVFEIVPVVPDREETEES